MKKIQMGSEGNDNQQTYSKNHGTACLPVAVRLCHDRLCRWSESK